MSRTKTKTTKIRRLRITKDTTVATFQQLAVKLVIKDRIQRAYQNHSAEMMALRHFKREHGYCGGSPSCMEFTGDARLCPSCLKNSKNPRYERPVYEYGKIRAKERQKERAAKKAEKVDEAVEAAPKRQRKAA